MHQKSESKSRNRVSARAKLEVSNVFYAYFILKQKNVKYGVFYYFSAVSFNYAFQRLLLQHFLKVLNSNQKKIFDKDFLSKNLDKKFSSNKISSYD